MAKWDVEFFACLVAAVFFVAAAAAHNLKADGTFAAAGAREEDMVGHHGMVATTIAEGGDDGDDTLPKHPDPTPEPQKMPADGIHHRCIHDEIKMENVPQIHVQYDRPDAVGGGGAVHMTVNHEGFVRSSVALSTGTWNSMRFAFFFNVDGNGQCTNVSQVVTNYRGGTATCTANDILTAEKKAYITDVLMSQATTYLSSALKVVPVSGNLTINGNKCGATPGISVPAAHQTLGVANADFIMYVTANPLGASFAGSLTVAYASTCFRDTNGRPVVGHINFIPAALANAASPKPSTTTLDVNTAIHEASHALGFSSPFFGSYGWVNESGYRFYTSGTTGANNNCTGKFTTYITTPRVLREARAYFNCSTLFGLEIEDQGGAGTQGSHWEKRIAYQDYIAGILSTSITYMSSFTLAYFEDTGFYKANYGVAQNDLMTWGKNKGCSFATCRCNTASNQASGEFCFDQTSTPYCTYDLTAGGYCGVSTFTSAVPAGYQYFSSAFVGGTVTLADYCPAVLPYSNQVCIEPTNRDTQDIYGNTYSAASRCFKSNLIQSDFSVSSTLSTRCFPFSCSIVTGAILVNVQGQTVRCPSNLKAGFADTANLRGFVGSIYCPAAALLCPDPFAPTPAPTPAPPTPAPTPAPPGYTPAPAPVVHTAKLWYNPSMPTTCSARAPCAANLTSLFPACRLLALRLVDCFGTDCDATLQGWLQQKGYADRCGDMEAFASQCQESFVGAASLCTLATGGATLTAISVLVVLVFSLVTFLV